VDGAVFGELSILNIQGNKTGNRRTANVRSVGYSDIFVLLKNDLWEVLQDYPDARDRLVERGTAILRKDNLIDEEALIRSKKEQETLIARSEKLTDSLQQLNEHFTQLLIGFTETQIKLKQRIIRLEGAINGLSPWESSVSGLDHQLSRGSPANESEKRAKDETAGTDAADPQQGMTRSYSLRIRPPTSTTDGPAN
jgi:hypothetical protein